MQHVKLGRNGPTVTRLGLGLAALGRPGYITLGHADDLGRDYGVLAMRAHAHEVLEAAYRAGVRFFDTARSYGRGEQFLAGWLAHKDRSELFVSSKWGYAYTAGWRVDAVVHEEKEHSAERLTQQLAETCSLIGESLALYQIHSATVQTGVLENAAVIAGLARIKASGTLVGLTVTGPEQSETLRRALAVTVDGRLLFDTVQATWNLFETSVGPALREAHDAGLGVIVKEGLANGRLTRRNEAPADAPKLAVIGRLAEAAEVGLDAVALAAILHQPFVDVALMGAATAAQVRSNVRALDVKLDAAALAELATLREDASEYWRYRARMPWG